MNLSDIRRDIDLIDSRLIDLFRQRMAKADQVAAYKKEHGLPILAPGREQEKLDAVALEAGPELAQASRVLYDLLFELSRLRQSQKNGTADFDDLPASPCRVAMELTLRPGQGSLCKLLARVYALDLTIIRVDAMENTVHLEVEISRGDSGRSVGQIREICETFAILSCSEVKSR